MAGGGEKQPDPAEIVAIEDQIAERLGDVLAQTFLRRDRIGHFTPNGDVNVLDVAHDLLSPDGPMGSFLALVWMAHGILERHYPAALFGGDAPFGRDPGGRFVTTLREAVDEILPVLQTSGATV